MPSGAKKRKASKKKKENQSVNQPDSAPAHGEDDRESDVREVSSPMSRDHQKLPMEGEDGEIVKESEVTDPSFVEEEVSATQFEKEIKIEYELDKKDGAHGGGSSGSSGSSSNSDDESHGIKKVQAESIVASVGSVEPDDCVAEGGNSVVESFPATNTEKTTVSSERVELDVLSSADNDVAPPVIESSLNENGKKKCCSVKESTGTHAKGEANAQSAECIPPTLDRKECITQENDDRSTSTHIASTAAVDNGSHHVKDSEITQRVAAPSPYPIEKTSWKSCCGLFEVFSASGA